MAANMPAEMHAAFEVTCNEPDFISEYSRSPYGGFIPPQLIYGHDGKIHIDITVPENVDMAQAIRAIQDLLEAGGIRCPGLAPPIG